MPRAGLSANIVVEAAGVLADEGGFDAVTLATLASRLGVKPPSLYKHVASLEAIQRGLALKGLNELHARVTNATVGLAGVDALSAFAAAYLRFSRDRPGLYAATLRVRRGSDGELGAAARTLEGVVGSIVDGLGVSLRDAPKAARAVLAAVHGYVSLNAFGNVAPGVDAADGLNRLVQMVAAGLGSAPPTPRRVLRVGRFSLSAGISPRPIGDAALSRPGR